MNPGRKLYARLKSNFPFQPNAVQEEGLIALTQFLISEDPLEIFVLKGYAGTGKTTLIAALVNSVSVLGYSTVLLAPTGRAAKVMSRYSGRRAFTIHRGIYHTVRDPEGRTTFRLQKNKYKRTVFVIDEASMISTESGGLLLRSSRSLLEDTLRFVLTGKGCRLILVGDQAQLPPIELDESPALNTALIQQRYQLNTKETNLTEVMRQHQSSGILFNATKIRYNIEKENFNGYYFDLNFNDVVALTDPYEASDALQMAYDRGLEETVVIVRSNKRANQYNQQIRMTVLGMEGRINAGDFLMVVKNNYYWLKPEDGLDFIANGDIAEVLEIFGQKALHGFEFAKVKLRLIDYDLPPFEATILLDTLESQSSALNQEQAQQLYNSVLEDYQHLPTKKALMEAIGKDPYLHALQVKFSYAMTCHKTQGGQWDTVFVEKPYLTDGEDISYLRWLYTAVTRAKKKLYLMGFESLEGERF